ncbi:MAG: redoxin domain-containing protein [Tannerellaceae bacterium]|jgi:hypothetical protein|nr:redoxin domain-containing protein [Tannerellaceae bacterium]
MKRFLISLLLIILLMPALFASRVELSFPALAGKSAQVYYFRGLALDSLPVVLNGQGKGEALLPDGYYGFIQIALQGTGSVECIGGEDLLIVEADTSLISRETVRFSASPENDFFMRMFDAKSQNIRRRSWIDAGMQLYGKGADGSSDLYPTLLAESQRIDRQAANIEEQIIQSNLYASKLLRIITFLDDMQTAILSGRIEAGGFSSYLQKDMDWDALYHAGQFWRYVHETYLRLFAQAPNLSQTEKEQRYVDSLSPLFGQLSEPLRSALLETAYTVCEQAGWGTAQAAIVAYISDNNIETDARNENLARMLAAGKTLPGMAAPKLKGLASDEFRGISIVIFYESGCDQCVTQLGELQKYYERLRNTGIEVISVAADADPRVFKYHSAAFPWPQKLCDYKGFGGDNFVNYAVIGTPTIFVLADGIIIGRYATLADTKLLK